MPQPLRHDPFCTHHKPVAYRHDRNRTKARPAHSRGAAGHHREGDRSPLLGPLLRFDEEGTYRCRQCGAALYRSEDKFDAGCGWPSFDDELPGAIRRQRDADGRRTEILCARCGAHLGHVFAGEGFTPKNLRHCVNSISLTFEPKSAEQHEQTAIFAGGCFWGVEYMFSRVPGVRSIEAGYTGGHTENPTYEEVCSHTTGHAEAVRIRFDPAQVSYETLARLFFEIHDPTQADGQGPDIGDQYRSELFYTTPEQREVGERLIGELRAKGYDVVTRITPASHFWPARPTTRTTTSARGSSPIATAAYGGSEASGVPEGG